MTFWGGDTGYCNFQLSSRIAMYFNTKYLLCEPCQDVPLSTLMLIYYHCHGNNHEQFASTNNLMRMFTLLSIGQNNFPRICTSEPAHWKAVS